MKWFVAVSGNIGSGKSTVTTLLSEKLGWKPYYEVVDENPYLPDFYANMPRWSFHLRGRGDLRPQPVPAGADGRTRLPQLLRTVQYDAAVSAPARSHSLPAGSGPDTAGAHPPAGP